MTSMVLKNSKFMEGFNKVAEGGTKVAQNVAQKVSEIAKDPSKRFSVAMGTVAMGFAIAAATSHFDAESIQQGALVAGATVSSLGSLFSALSSGKGGKE